MHEVDAKFGSKRVRLLCHESAVSHAKTFLDGLARLGTPLRDNLSLPLGFSHLVLREEGETLTAYEPNYATNPVIALRSDVTTTLALHADMLAVAHRHGLAPRFPHFMDRVLVSRAWAHAPKLRMFRGEQHWNIEVPGAHETTAIRAYELLGARPLLLTAFALAPGSVLDVDGDQITFGS